jgi:integrase
MDHSNLYYREHKSLLKRAGVEDEGFTFHSVQHSCATVLFAWDEHPKVFLLFLGHTTITHTMDTYSHAMPGMQDTAIVAMEATFS